MSVVKFRLRRVLDRQPERVGSCYVGGSYEERLECGHAVIRRGHKAREMRCCYQCAEDEHPLDTYGEDPLGGSWS